MNIGNKTYELRKKCNMTQEKLANKIGISRQTLASWESNITSPDLSQAALLSKELNISLDELVDNHLDIICQDNTYNVLLNLIGKTCYLTINNDFDIFWFIIKN